MQKNYNYVISVYFCGCWQVVCVVRGVTRQIVVAVGVFGKALLG